MRGRFEQLVRQIADESSPGDAGLVISSETKAAYQGLLAIYHQIVESAVQALATKERGAAQYCMEFIGDSERTILMIRAINRAILARRRTDEHNLLLVEAGMGSGLLLAAALALDPELHCAGYDKMKGNYEVTERLISSLAYSTRTQLHHLDLLKHKNSLHPHVLVAEHINQGLTAEHATKIPRLFAIAPEYVVPYAVIPGVYWSGTRRTDRGERIVLGDRLASNHFKVTGHLRLPPKAVQPIAVCCDIEWGSSQFGGASLLQASSNQLKQTGWENHLIQAVFLPARHRNDDEVVALENTSLLPRNVFYQVSYPIGTFVSGRPILPTVKVDVPDVVVTTVFRGRAQLMESLSPIRSLWWRGFA